MGTYYEVKDPKMCGTKTEANLIKSRKTKSIEKMKKTLYQQAAGREAPNYRQLSNFLGEYATNSYLHAAVFHRVLWGPYTDVEKNLEVLIEQEHAHAAQCLPEYAKIAREEGFEEIAQAFEQMAKIDTAQEKKLIDILNKIRNDSIFNKEEAQEWYCQQCGNLHHSSSAPESCSLCNSPKRYFELNGSNHSEF